MRKVITIVFMGLMAVSPAGAQTATKPADPEVRTETLDARVSAGTLVAMSDSDVTVKTETGARKIPLSDLSEMTCKAPGDPLSAPEHAVVMTSAGGYVTASSLTLGGGKINFTNSSLGGVSFAFSSVAAIYLPASGQSAAQVAAKCAEMGLEPGEQDVVVVARKTGGWLSVQGILKSADDKALTFSWKGTDRQISMPTVRAVFLAPTTAAKPEKFRGMLTLGDGSSVRFTSLTYDKYVFNVALSGAGETKMPAGKVASVKFVSDRVVNLGDLKPLAVKQHGLLDTTMGWRLNRSVSGAAIVLGGRSYSRGIGLHSFCELTYGLDAQYKALIATIGIDDIVRPGGDASLTFLGDGKELLAPLRVTGKGKPLAVRIPLAGVKSFVIRVDYGKDKLDVGDHVDFAGARLIK